MNKNKDNIIALYKKTRLQQPSAELDDKILAAAKQQLQYKAKKPKRIIWALSSVAVVVLSVNVALKLLLEPSVTMLPPPIATSSPQLRQESTDFQMDNAIAEKEIKKDVLMQKSLAKQQRSQAMQTAKKQKLEMRQSRSMTDELMSSPSVIAEQSLISDSLKLTATTPPIIPFNILEISKLNKEIIALQKNNDEINVYIKQKLILSLIKSPENGIKITAYPQDNELGLKIDWSLKPQQLKHCDNAQCAINNIQTGYFKNDTLIKVSWIQ